MSDYTIDLGARGVSSVPALMAKIVAINKTLSMHKLDLVIWKHVTS